MSTDSAVEPLTDEWVEALAEASVDRRGRSGVVAIAIGKKKLAVLDIIEGRVAVGAAPEAAAVTIPVTGKQLDAILSGEESLAQAFMRGDVKPAGATGALLAAIELFEDTDFRQRLDSGLA